jgi:hypothetical protein
MRFTVPEPQSTVGASDAGEAAALSYLKHLRAGGFSDPTTALTALVEAIQTGSHDVTKNGRPTDREIMLFNFLATLDTWLRSVAVHAGGKLDALTGESLEQRMREGLAKTKEQSDREWRSRIAKRAWETRRRRTA